MTNFLIRLFIGKQPNPNEPHTRGKYASLAGVCGIILNVFLFAGKLTIGILSASVAIIADAFNNLTDAGSSLISLFGFILSGQKADSEHPFGHGRIEYIAGTLISAAIILVGFELLKSSVNKILS